MDRSPGDNAAARRQRQSQNNKTWQGSIAAITIDLPRIIQITIESTWPGMGKRPYPPLHTVTSPTRAHVKQFWPPFRERRSLIKKWMNIEMDFGMARSSEGNVMGLLARS